MSSCATMQWFGPIWARGPGDARGRGLAAGYQGSEVIRDIDFQVESGEAVMIIGSNGAGKTTLFRSDAWATPTFLGRGPVHGLRHCRDACTADRPSRISFVPAERRLFPRMSVQENLPRRLSRSPRPGDSRAGHGSIPRLAERKDQHAGTMSGGEQQMLAMGRALMAKPDLLVLDEPTTGLAPKLAAEAYEALGVPRRRGLTVLVAEQQVPLRWHSVTEVTCWRTEDRAGGDLRGAGEEPGGSALLSR